VKNLLLSIASIEAEGLESVVLAFLFAGESPGLLGIKEDRGLKEEVLIPRIRGYIFHG
jgi:hypothetical protein